MQTRRPSALSGVVRRRPRRTRGTYTDRRRAAQGRSCPRDRCAAQAVSCSAACDTRSADFPPGTASTSKAAATRRRRDRSRSGRCAPPARAVAPAGTFERAGPFPRSAPSRAAPAHAASPARDPRTRRRKPAAEPFRRRQLLAMLLEHSRRATSLMGCARSINLTAKPESTARRAIGSRGAPSPRHLNCSADEQSRSLRSTRAEFARATSVREQKLDQELADALHPTRQQGRRPPPATQAVASPGPSSPRSAGLQVYAFFCWRWSGSSCFFFIRLEARCRLRGARRDKSSPPKPSYVGRKVRIDVRPRPRHCGEARPTL